MNRLVLVAFLALGGCSPQPSSITYEVYGTAPEVSLVMQNETGGTENRERVPLPFVRMLTMPTGSFAYLSAQNQGRAGSVICRITVDGRLWKEARSDGGYTIATCDGRVGYQ